MVNIIKQNRSDQSKKLNLDAALPTLPLQHIWYEMKKKGDWASMLLLPTSDHINALDLAHGLGLMAVREPHDIVWVVNASSHSEDSVPPGDVDPDSENFPYRFVNLADLGINQEKQLFTAERMLEKMVEQEQMKTRLIFTVDPLDTNTHPIALCRAVDAVILCIELEKSTFNSVRRVVEIIGREKIMGSIVLRPKAA